MNKTFPDTFLQMINTAWQGVVDTFVLNVETYLQDLIHMIVLYPHCALD